MMKRVIVVAVMVILMAPAVSAQGIRLGVGGFGGGNIPIVQDDQKTGTVFGVMAKIKVLPFLAAEPNVTFGKWGEPDPIDGTELGIDGSKINSYGIDAVLGAFPAGPGFKPYGFVGGAIYSVKNDDTGYDESKAGWSLGLGFGVGVMEMIDLDLRGRLVIAPQEEGSKKAANITGGITYYFNIGQ